MAEAAVAATTVEAGRVVADVVDAVAALVMEEVGARVTEVGAMEKLEVREVTESWEALMGDTAFQDQSTEHSLRCEL